MGFLANDCHFSRTTPSGHPLRIVSLTTYSVTFLKVFFYSLMLGGPFPPFRIASLFSPQTVRVPFRFHFTDKDLYTRLLNKVFGILDALKQASPNSSFVFTQTVPQHFYTASGTGDYWEKVGAGTRRRLGYQRQNHNQRQDMCAPLVVPPAACDSRGRLRGLTWRHRIAFEIAQRFPRIKMLPTEDLMISLFDIHFSSQDCTHWCYSPSLTEAWAWLIRRAIRDGDQRPPLAGNGTAR